MSTLFGVDDLVLKADGKRVDWSRPGEVLRFVTRHAGEGGSPLRRVARVGSVASRLKREGQAIVETRCERGAGVVRQLELPEAAAVAVRELDEHWDGSGQPYGISGDEISIVGRVGCVAQNAELFLAAGGQTAMRKMLGERRGRWFEPALADALLAIGASDPIWPALQNGSAELSLAAARAGGHRARRGRCPPRSDRRDVRGDRRCQVALHRASLARRRTARRHDRRRAGLQRRRPARPAPRRAAARPRQARDLEHDPRQAGQARRQRVRAGQGAPRLHRADPRSRPGVRTARGRRGRAPRADRWPRLPVRPAGPRADAVHPGARRLRRVRGADRGPAISRRHVGRAGPRDHAPGRRLAPVRRDDRRARARTARGVAAGRLSSTARPSDGARGCPEIDAVVGARVRRSIAASSSCEKPRLSSAPTLSSSWATLEAPISVDVTRGSRSVQASAIWARL